jgi:CubicO group peptidase (beta-lactamase class C family)
MDRLRFRRCLDGFVRCQGGRITGWLVVAWLAAALTTWAAPFAALESMLEGAVQEIGPFGLCLVEDGAVVYQWTAAGFDPEQPMPIYSASKWLSAAVIASLVDDGRLDLDDPAAEWFPALRVDDHPITVRHLFSHTSGLPAWVPDGVCTDAMTLQACAERLSGLPILTCPGRVFAYGELSMQIGGAIAEIVGGASWDQLFVRRLAQPLGMASTDYGAFGASSNPVIGGGVRSTLFDYTRFVAMLLGGGLFDGRRVLSADAVATLLAEQTTETAVGPANGYGLGCWRDRVDPASGATTLASSPGARGFTPWVDLEHGLAGVLAVEGDGTKAWALYQEILTRIDALIGAAADDP